MSRASFRACTPFVGCIPVRPDSRLTVRRLETSDHGPYNSWDRLPYLTTVLNGTKTIDSAYNHLESNMFFSGSPFSIDTDDGSDRVNCTSNVIVAQPLFKTDFSGHTKTFQNNVALYGSCGGSEAGASDHTNVPAPANISVKTAETSAIRVS